MPWSSGAAAGASIVASPRVRLSSDATVRRSGLPIGADVQPLAGRRRVSRVLRSGGGRCCRLNRRAVRDVPAQGLREISDVVRIDLGVVPAARDGHVGQPPIDELWPELAVSTCTSTRSAVCPWLLWLVTA